MFLFLISLTLASATCPIYSCTEEALEVDQCVQKSGEAYSIEPCTDSIKSECSISSSGNGTCKAPTSSSVQKYPGEKCSISEDCMFSKGCVETICQGSSINETCADTHYCNPGLYCSAKSICEQPSNKECSSDYDCSNSYTCNNNQCVKYLSINANKDCGVCNDGLNMACKSSACLSTGSENYCLDYISHPSKNATLCSNDDDCVSNKFGSLNLTINSPCNCGMNPSGNSYCALLPGDEVYRKYLELLEDWIEGDGIKKCNSMRRLAYDCIADWWDKKHYIQFVYYHETLLNYPKFQEMDYCTQKVYYGDYTNIKDQFDNIKDLNIDFAMHIAVGFWVLSLI